MDSAEIELVDELVVGVEVRFVGSLARMAKPKVIDDSMPKTPPSKQSRKGLDSNS
jgi:hypothetical protein